MKETDPLNRTTGPQILRFFDICFKQGVVDAYNLTNDYEAREFVKRHKAAWDFAVLGDQEDFDWQMWRFTLYRWARNNRLTPFGENYLYKIVKKNYLWCLLPFCMQFYLMGIEEWLQYPNPGQMERFLHETRVHWAPQANPSLRRMSKADIRYCMQEFAMHYRRLPKEQQPVSYRTMDGYCEAIYALNQKYVNVKKIRIPEE